MHHAEEPTQRGCRLKTHEAAQGNADIAAAKAIKPDVEQNFAKYGIR